MLSVIGNSFSSWRGPDVLLCHCSIAPGTLTVSQLRCVKAHDMNNSTCQYRFQTLDWLINLGLP